MTRTRAYLNIDATWSRLDPAAQAQIGNLVLKIAVCRARRTHASANAAEARFGAIVETALLDELYALARQLLPDAVASNDAIQLGRLAVCPAKAAKEKARC